jgi:hypothetical protein
MERVGAHLGGLRDEIRPPRGNKTLAISLLLPSMLVLTGCFTVLKGVNLRNQGDVVESVSLITTSYSKKESSFAQKQLYLSVAECATELRRDYDYALRTTQINELHRLQQQIDRDVDVVADARRALRNADTSCRDCMELRDDAEYAWEELVRARNALQDHRDEQAGRFALLQSTGTSFVVDRSVSQLEGAVAAFSTYWKGPHPVQGAWSVACSVLANPGTASSNLGEVNAFLQDHGAVLPADLQVALIGVRDEVGERVDQGKSQARNAREAEEDGQYRRARDLALSASEWDSDGWSGYLEYLSALNQSLDLVSARASIESLVALRGVVEMFEHPTGALRELEHAGRSAIEQYSSIASNERASMNKRARAIQSLDAVTVLASLPTEARRHERSIVEKLPTPAFDVVLARVGTVSSSSERAADTTARAVRDASRAAGHSFKTFGVVDSLALQEAMESYPRESLWVVVEVRQFYSDVETSQHTENKEYVAGYNVYQVVNPCFLEWQAKMRQCEQTMSQCENATSDVDQILCGLAVAECVGVAAVRPAEQITMRDPITDWASYTTTTYSSQGRYEIDVTLRHAPGGRIFRTVTIEDSITDDVQAVSCASGDCSSAGVKTYSATKPTTRDVDNHLLESIDRKSESAIRSAMEREDIVEWLVETYPRNPLYVDLLLGNEYQERGVGGVMRRLGLFKGDGCGAEFSHSGFRVDCSKRSCVVEAPDDVLHFGDLRRGDVLLAVNGVTGDRMRNELRSTLVPALYCRVKGASGSGVRDVIVLAGLESEEEPPKRSSRRR